MNFHAISCFLKVWFHSFSILSEISCAIPIFGFLRPSNMEVLSETTWAEKLSLVVGGGCVAGG